MADAGEHDSALERAWESYNGGGDRTSFAAVKAVNALAKVEHTLELIKEILDSTTGVLVYSDHVQAVTKIYESLPVGTAKFITGSTSMEARDKYVDDLNHGRIQVLVSTIGALKEGVNITGVNYQIFNDFPWVDADLEQVRKRIHRIGQTKTCFYYYLFSSKVDEYIFRALETKKKLAEEVGT
jgi:SNF2 family DNA or RNA helicase